MPAVSAPSKVNGDGVGAQLASPGIEETVHVVHVKVVGLTGVSVDVSQTPLLSGDGNPPPHPKQMKAVVAIMRDLQTHSITGLSRGLVQSAVLENHSQIPNLQKYIAVWDDRSKNSSDSSSKHPASFEASIPSNQQPEGRSRPHRNFELIVGLTSDDSSKATPIGAASLPIEEAARLSGSNGKVLLDLPVYNYASLTIDPFSRVSLEAAVPLPKKNRRKLSFARSRKKEQESTATNNMSREDIGTLVVVNQQLKLHALGYNYFMDPSRDAAVLRVELELQRKESNVEMDLRAPSFGYSAMGRKKKPRVVLLHTEEQGIETAATSTTTTPTNNKTSRTVGGDKKQRLVQDALHIMEPSIERVLSSKSGDGSLDKRAAAPPLIATGQSPASSPRSRRKSSKTRLNASAPTSKQFRVRIVDQTALEYDLKTGIGGSKEELKLQIPDNQQDPTESDNNLLVQEHAIERILSDNTKADSQASCGEASHFDEIEVESITSSPPREASPKPTKLMRPSVPPGRISSVSTTEASTISSPSRQTAQINIAGSISKSLIRQENQVEKFKPSSSSDAFSCYDVDSGRQLLSIEPLESNSVARSKISVVSTAPIVASKNISAIQSEPVKSMSKPDFGSSGKFMQRKKLKPPPGSSKSLRKRGMQVSPIKAAVTAAAPETSPLTDSVHTHKKSIGSNETHQKTALTQASAAIRANKSVAVNDAIVDVSKTAETFAPITPSPVDRMKMNFERRLSGYGSTKIIEEKKSSASTLPNDLNPTTPPPSKPAFYSDPIPKFSQHGDLEFKRSFVHEEIASMLSEEPTFTSRKRAQPANSPNRAAEVARKLFGAMNLQPCSGTFRDSGVFMEREIDEDITLGSFTLHTEDGTFATTGTRRETIVDDLADLGLLVGRMCQQRGLGRVVGFDDDDETMTTAYGGHPRDKNSFEADEDTSSVDQPRKSNWLKGLNKEAMRSFGQTPVFSWNRPREDVDPTEMMSQTTEGSASISFVDEMEESLDGHDDASITDEGTEVEIAVTEQGSRLITPETGSGLRAASSNASIRSSKSKRSINTPHHRHQLLQQQKQLQPKPLFEEVLISGTSSHSHSTTELALTEVGPIPARDVASKDSVDRIKKGSMTDDESPKNVMNTPSVNVKSFTQSFVEMVTNAITPSSPDNRKDEIDAFIIPSVLEANFDVGSVGDLTATTLEMQIEMAEFRKQLERLQKEAKEAQASQIPLSELEAAAEASAAKLQVNGGHYV